LEWGTSGNTGDMIYASVYGSTKYYLDRENLAIGEEFYKDAATYESFTYSAPAGQQIIAEQFGVEFDPLPAGCLVGLTYKKDNDTTWTSLISNFQTDDAIETVVRKYLRCNSLKLRLVMRGSSSVSTNRPFISRVYVLGGLTSKP